MVDLAPLELEIEISGPTGSGWCKFCGITYRLSERKRGLLMLCRSEVKLR